MKVTLEITAPDWFSVRVALRQAAQRDLSKSVLPGPKGRYKYRVDVTCVQGKERDLPSRKGADYWPR